MKRVLQGIGLAAAWLAAACAGAVSTDGAATFRVSTRSYGGNYNPNHVLAIWVTDAQTNFVKTLKRQAATRVQYLYQWRAVSRSNVVDAVTGATLGSHQTHTLTWNCRDTNNVVVPDGTYRFFVEYTEDNAQGPWTATNVVSFYKGAAGVTSYPAAQTYFTNLMILYAPAPATNTPLPGTLEAEDYTSFSDTTAGNAGGAYRSDDVDIEACAEGGYDVSWIAAGEWLGFSTLVATTGYYDVRFRVASATAGARTLRLEVDGTNATGDVTFNTGGAGAQAWTNAWASNVLLNAGVRAMRIAMVSSNFSLNYAAITRTPTHDLAVNGIVTPGVIPPGSTTNVTVVATNRGDYAESFSVVLTNATDHFLVGSRSGIPLAAGAGTNLVFSWNTAGASTGFHVLVASAGPVAGETLTGNNTATSTVLLALGLATNRLILKGGAWRYSDEGLDLSATPWRTAAWYDGHWPQGPGVLGFGNGGEATVLAHPAPATNAFVLRNPGFELAGAAGAAQATNWGGETVHGVIMGSTWGNASRESWRSHGGSWMAAIYNWSGSMPTAGWWQSVTNALGAGSVWTAGVWAWNDNTAGGILFTNASRSFYLRIEMYDSAFTLVSLEQRNCPLPGEVWTRYQVSAVAPANAVWVRIVFGADGMGSSGALQFDDASLSGARPGRTTWYFRRDAFLDSTPFSATVNVRRDDGLALYVNGAEVLRDGLPTNALAAATPATNPVSGNAETNYIGRSIDPSALSPGRNVIAAEVHQGPGGQPAVESVWINEIHYDNTGTDTNEGIEIAGPAGADLAAYRLVLYNGGAEIYRTNALSGIVPAQTNNSGVLWFGIVGLQNGAADGVALVRIPTAVVQFLSYEGTITASVGTAAGMVSTDIGVSEPGAAGQSLQLVGTGVSYSAFTWTGPAAASAGLLNSGQAIPPAEADDLAFDLELVAVVPLLSLQSSLTLTSLRAPDNLLAGDRGRIRIGISNSGQRVETFLVTLVDTNTGQVIGSQVISNLVAGGVTEAVFDWSTLGLAAGDHGLLAYTVVGGVTNIAGALSSSTYFGGTGFGLNSVNATGSIGGRCTAVAASGGLLLVGAGATLEVWDRSAPLEPARLGAVRLPGLVRSLAVNGTTAYAACGPAGVQFVDISASARPVHVNMFDSSGEAHAVAAAGSYLYVADGIAGVRIVNVANPLSPSLAGAWHTTGPARAIAVSAGRAYVLDEYEGLVILDVSAPAAPVRLGGLADVTSARGLAVVGTTVLVSDDNGVLSVINAAVPGAPARTGSVRLNAFGEAIAATGSVAYVAAGDAGLLTIHTAGPSVVFTNATPDAAASVSLDGAALFVASGYGGVQTFDLSVPQAPALHGTYPAGARASEAVSDGVHAYVAAGERGLEIFSLANPASPVRVGAETNIGNARCVALAGSLAVVGDGTTGARVVDVSSPAAPVLLGTFGSTNLSFVRAAAAAGSMAAVTDGRHVLLLDLGAPAAPAQSAVYTSDGFVFDLAMDTGRVYAAAGGDGLKILSLPGLAEVGSYDTPGMAVAVTLDGDRAYVADGAGGWLLLDVSQPAAPSLVHTSTDEGAAEDVAVAGSLAAVGGPANRVSVLDLSNPLTPVPQASLGRVVRALRLSAAGGAYVLTAEDEAGLGIFGVASDDADGDGMPDSWEQQIADADPDDAIHGPADVLPGDDFDGDRHTNLEELVAGTDARDELSVFALSASGSAGGSYVVRWYSEPGKRYGVYRSTNLLSGFSVIQADVPAAPPVNAYTDSVGSVQSPLFYMISVR